jgi:hypothetical protein
MFVEILKKLKEDILSGEIIPVRGDYLVTNGNEECVGCMIGGIIRSGFTIVENTEITSVELFLDNTPFYDMTGKYGLSYMDSACIESAYMGGTCASRENLKSCDVKINAEISQRLKAFAEWGRSISPLIDDDYTEELRNNKIRALGIIDHMISTGGRVLLPSEVSNDSKYSHVA